MDVKDILKKRRIEKQLTLDDVGRLVGVSAATISRWESGDIANMKRDKIVKLAKALDISPAIIMEWDEDNTTQTQIQSDSEFPPDIRAAARGMMELNEADKKSAIDMINFLSKRGKEAKEN